MKIAFSVIVLFFTLGVPLAADQTIRVLINPSELTLLTDKVTLEYSPDSKVMKPEYTYYHFKQKEFLEVFSGKMPKESFYAEVLLKKSAKENYKPGKDLPQPSGGFTRNTYEAMLIKDLTKDIKIMAINLDDLEPGKEPGTLQYSPDSMVMKARYDVYVFDESQLRASFGGKLTGLQENVTVLVLSSKEQASVSGGEGALPSGGIRLILHKAQVLSWN